MKSKSYASAGLMLLAIIAGCSKGEESDAELSKLLVAPEGKRVVVFRPEGEPARSVRPLIPVTEPYIQVWTVKETASDALGRIGEEAVPSLVEALNHPDPDVREQAARALSLIGPKAVGAVPELIKLLDDESEPVRRQAARAWPDRTGSESGHPSIDPSARTQRTAAQHERVDAAGAQRSPPPGQPRLIRMTRGLEQLRRDALQICAGVAAVDSERLVCENVRVEGNQLHIGDDLLDLAGIRRIVAVGAGKAGAGMAAGLEAAFGSKLLAEKQVTGWLNVPADCVRTLSKIHLHAARPAGLNEPTAEGVAGSEQILQLVASLEPSDLCIALISGGGSALLPAPCAGITLADKQAVTRHLALAGATSAS